MFYKHTERRRYCCTAERRRKVAINTHQTRALSAAVTLVQGGIRLIPVDMVVLSDMEAAVGKKDTLLCV